MVISDLLTDISDKEAASVVLIFHLINDLQEHLSWLVLFGKWTVVFLLALDSVFSHRFFSVNHRAAAGYISLRAENTTEKQNTGLFSEFCCHNYIT